MKYLKYFESSSEGRAETYNDIVAGMLLLCADNSFYFQNVASIKFTKGKKYKLYKSPRQGMRLKDDNNNFQVLFSWVEGEDGILIFKNFIGNIFTTDNSLEDYERRMDAKKFGL